MKILAAVALSLVLVAGGRAGAVDWTLSPDGYGPVRIGMAPAEAALALGMALAPTDPTVAAPDPECHHLHAPALEGEDITFMVEHGRISRVSVYSGPLSTGTDRGITIGSTEAEVLAAYGDSVEIQPAEYVDGHDVVVWDEGAGRGIRFVTMAADPADLSEPLHLHVSEIHVGGESIHWVEGCS
ncbi:hypothetical protein L2U69_07905 [Zavarzinia compransoris]|uniref:hypothetical protein n=1 Tax=Zavarzinia marina TaxID=2911065 RepID=UPI001F317703|nr:hypothetical protein [Zavarzinia marina]MCF4165562.1 hypothetical protein [Zavarzinia marina]